MKKIIIMAALFLFSVPSVYATKTADACAYIKDGTIMDKLYNPIKLGYDKWGYNYEAHMFNGFYGNYTRPQELVAQGDRLMMKWNDAWMSSKDCGTQDIIDQAEYSKPFTPDHYLDRHYGSDKYIGSGAWLTNHASGSYQSKEQFHWDVSGDHVITFNLNGLWSHDVSLTDTNGVLAGGGGYPAGGPYMYWWHSISGSVSGNAVSFDFVYDGGPDAVGAITHMTGSIDPETGAMSGDWTDNYLGSVRQGTWSISAPAKKVYEACQWSDFVKIVAVPENATQLPSENCSYDQYGLDNMQWNIGSDVLGCSIWGSFAVTQEVSTDPCGEKMDIRDYRGSLRRGLGNW